MIHKSQKPIKYYFLKKDISWFNCTENQTKETVIYFDSFFVTLIHIFNYYLMSHCTEKFLVFPIS